MVSGREARRGGRGIASRGASADRVLRTVLSVLDVEQKRGGDHGAPYKRTKWLWPSLPPNEVTTRPRPLHHIPFRSDFGPRLNDVCRSADPSEI